MKRWLGGIVAAITLAPAVSHAQSGPLVRLDLACEKLDQPVVRRVMEAELGAELVDWDAIDVTVVRIECDESNVAVQVRDPVTRKTLSRQLSLHRMTEGSKERLVALATAELVIASWAELEVIGAPAVEPAGRPPPPELVRAAREVVREEMAEPNRQRPRTVTRHGRTLRVTPHQRLIPLVSARGFVNHSGMLRGGGVRYGAELRRVFSWAVDGLIERGIIGDIDITTTNVGGQIAFSYQGPAGAIRGGAGLRFGITRTELLGGGTQSTAAPWGWPMLVGSFNVGSRGLVLEGAFEGGYAVMPSTPGGSEGSLEGVWLSGQMGIGWSW